MTSKKPMTPEEFQKLRRKTIEMLEPECIPEMENCAAALDLSFDEFLSILHSAAADEEYYHHMGDNESYHAFDWEKIWRGFEILTDSHRPKGRWGNDKAVVVPFSCSC